MSDVICPVCGSSEHGVEPYAPTHSDDSGDWTCSNPDCQAKFIWPQPPPPEPPTVDEVAAQLGLSPDVVQRMLDELGAT